MFGNTKRRIELLEREVNVMQEIIMDLTHEVSDLEKESRVTEGKLILLSTRMRDLEKNIKGK